MDVETDHRVIKLVTLNQLCSPFEFGVMLKLAEIKLVILTQVVSISNEVRVKGHDNSHPPEESAQS